MALTLFSPKPSLTVILDNGNMTVQPSALSSLPSEDPILRGRVILKLPSARSIHQIQVQLQARCDVWGGGNWRYESSIPLKKELSIDLEGECLEAGEHAYVLVSQAHDSRFARKSLKGRITEGYSTLVSHRIKALTGPDAQSGKFDSLIYTSKRFLVKAKIQFHSSRNASFLHGTVVHSEPKEVFIVADPTPLGALPELYSLEVQHLSPDLGPIAALFSSHHLAVSSLLHVHIHMISSTEQIVIQSVTVYITQTFKIQYEDADQIANPKPEKHILTKLIPSSLFPKISSTGDDSKEEEESSSVGSSLSSSALSSSCRGHRRPVRGHFQASQAPSSSSLLSTTTDQTYVDQNPLEEIKKGESWVYNRIMRIPNDSQVRPSTLEGSENRINVNHKVSLELRYRKEGDEQDKVLVITKSIVIASCCSSAQAAYLPAYSKKPSSINSKEVAASARLNRSCLCYLTSKELFDQEGNILERAGSESALRSLNSTTPFRDDKSPTAWSLERTAMSSF